MISGNSASFGFDEVDENGRSTNTAFYSGHLGNAQGASGDQLASSLNSKFKDYEFATKPQLPNGSIGGGFMPGEDLVGGTFKAGGMLLLKKVGANFIFKKSLAAFGMAVIKRPLISASTKVEQTVSHHIFNVFRGKSPGSQKYRDFFLKHKIKVDDHTVKIPNSLHTFIHGKGKDWTNKWRKWIDDHPNATTKDVYQQAGKMMDKAGIGHLPIMPHRKK